MTAHGRDLLTEVDIAIIGAGVMGVSAAYRLSRQSSLKIAIVDQFGPLGGMSGRTFGQVRLHYSNANMLEMARFGIEHFRNWDKEVGIGSCGYVPMGYLLTAKKEQFEAAKRNVALAQSLGIETEFIGPEDIKRIEPSINEMGLEGAAWDPTGGYVDITRIVLAWLAAAQSCGHVSIASKTKVNEISTRNGSVTGLNTSRGFIKAKQVIVATGPWSTPLIAPLGLQVPIETRRLDTMYMALPAQASPLRTCVTDGTSNIVVRPDFGPTLLAAAYPPEMALVDDPIVEPSADSDAAHLGRIEQAFTQRFPGLVGATPIRSVSGSYDITPDWHPILGSAPEIEGLHLAMGFSGHGLKLAPAVGQALAECVLELEPSFDIQPLRLERFAENQPMFLAYGPGGRA